MRFEVNIPEIGAEMLLNYLYPELEERWKVRNEGTFYRNYNNDALSVSAEKEEISLARDGFLKLLPQGLISPEDELQKGDKKEKHKEIERRKKILKEVFVPIDTITFRRKLRVEKEISNFLNEKLEYILQTYFGVNYRSIENQYIKELASLLPYIRSRRADFGMIRNILASLFECEVNLYTGRFSKTDSTKCWLPLIRFELLIEHLDNENFNKLMKELKPVSSFISEWFIPAEMRCEILIKDHGEDSLLTNRLTLGYNTFIN